VGSRLQDLLKSFNEETDEPNAAIIASYLGIIKERNDQIANLNIMISERDKLIAQHEDEWDICFSTISSCLHSDNSTNNYDIYIPGGKAWFNVLCDNQIAGPGWLVIQQRLDGSGDFKRNWTEYRNGFGQYDGNFFFGLEKIYRLTSSYPHELYIYLEQEDGKIINALYDRFEISGEDDEYRLLSLGKYTGNDKDRMRGYEHMKFYTFDRDHSFIGCARGYFGSSGWWYTEYCGDW